MTIAISSDHAGNVLRAAILEWLVERGYPVTDLGPQPGESVDYPDRARPLAEAVRDGRFDRGILVCGTGQGMAIAANKVPGVRAAVVADAFSARMAMAHNDARVLCLGERVVGAGVALDCVEGWLATEFEGGRHARRVGKIE
ncbi:MAG: ribose 5-phosphate isomerase B [Myxococcota bacterium]